MAVWCLDQMVRPTELKHTFPFDAIPPGGPYKDHLFLRHQSPFPRSLGIGTDVIGSTHCASAIIVYLTSMGSVAVSLDLEKIGKVDAE